MAERSSSLARRSRNCCAGCARSQGRTLGARCALTGRLVADLFADIIDAGLHLLTYGKNTAGKDIAELRAEEFSVVSDVGDDGRRGA